MRRSLPLDHRESGENIGGREISEWEEIQTEEVLNAGIGLGEHNFFVAEYGKKALTKPLS